MRENLTSKRTDVHRPAEFDPADYRVIDYIDNKRPEPPRVFTEEATDAYKRIVAIWQERIFEHFPDWRTGGGDHSSIHQCNHCGHPGIRWVAVVEHVPTGDKLAFGEICAERCDLPGHDAFKAKFIRDRAQREAAAYAKILAKAEFEIDHPEAVKFLHDQSQAENDWREWNEAHPHGGRNAIRAPHTFILDMVHTFNRKGELSDAQVKAVEKFAAKHAEFAARDAEREAERQAELANAEPLPEGRYEIEGEIISTKWQKSDYGDQFKMLVKFDDGNKVWGTVPESLWTVEIGEHGHSQSKAPEKGDRVRFKAQVTRSEDDQHFGFFKRPRNAEIVEARGELVTATPRIEDNPNPNGLYR